jgi:hypothetical protein
MNVSEKFLTHQFKSTLSPNNQETSANFMFQSNHYAITLSDLTLSLAWNYRPYDKFNYFPGCLSKSPFLFSISPNQSVNISTHQIINHSLMPSFFQNNIVGTHFSVNFQWFPFLFPSIGFDINNQYSFSVSLSNITFIFSYLKRYFGLLFRYENSNKNFQFSFISNFNVNRFEMSLLYHYPKGTMILLSYNSSNYRFHSLIKTNIVKSIASAVINFHFLKTEVSISFSYPTYSLRFNISRWFDIAKQQNLFLSHGFPILFDSFFDFNSFL